MKRFMMLVLVLLLMLSLSPMATARVEYRNLDELDENAIYTYEDMIAIYELGYRDGQHDAKADDDFAWVTRSETVTSDTTSTVSYVVNTNTGKFHYLTCKSVGQIKDKNRMDFSGTREELISAGYSPCGNCKP